MTDCRVSVLEHFNGETPEVFLNDSLVPFQLGINIVLFAFRMTDILPKKILAQDYLKSLEQMQDEEADF